MFIVLLRNLLPPKTMLLQMRKRDLAISSVLSKTLLSQHSGNINTYLIISKQSKPNYTKIDGIVCLFIKREKSYLV